MNAALLNQQPLCAQPNYWLQQAFVHSFSASSVETL